MFKYIAAAVAALTLSVATPTVADEPQTSVSSAICTPIVNGVSQAQEPCQVHMTFNPANAAVGIGFAMAQSGNAIYVGQVVSQTVVNVVGFGTGPNPVPASGQCVSQNGTTLTCSATVESPNGRVTLAVKAVAN